MKDFLTMLARGAGAIIRARYQTALTITAKSSPQDVVTEVDLAANAWLLKKIRARYPTHGIVSEEAAAWQADANTVWYIDPLDGTMNFVSGIPLFSVGVAVAEQGEITHSAIYNVMTNELYLAERGHGASKNGAAIRPSAATTLTGTRGCGGGRLRDVFKRAALKQLLTAAERAPFILNGFGSALIQEAYVADGRYDWCIASGAEAWDYAPGVHLLQEAGCLATDFAGRSWRLGMKQLVAANPKLHPELLAIVRQAVW